LEDRRKDGANPWKQVRNRLKAYLQEEEEEDFLIYGSFNDAVSSPEYTEYNDRTINE
jgi:hypothetical protein